MRVWRLVVIGLVVCLGGCEISVTSDRVLDPDRADTTRLRQVGALACARTAQA
jgi:hypothetical protein